TACAEFAVYAVGDFLTGFRIDDFALNAEHMRTDSVDTYVKRIGCLRHGGRGRSFRLAVGNTNFAHMHFVDNVLHHLYRARASCHNTGAHMAEIRFVEILMSQHSDKHGWYAVEAGDFFAVDAVQSFFW